MMDPITLDICWNRLIGVVNEQAAALMRTSFTSIVREAGDLSAGVFDAQNLVTIPHAKLVRMLGRLSAAQLADVERRVCLWLGLPAASPKVS